MIGSLRGEVLERELTGTALVEVAGVGYVVNVTERTLAELEPGAKVFLHVHHHVAETVESLFGFLRRDERLTFQSLIKINKVGPSLAMAVLATHTPATLVDIVAANDAGALSLVPGIGKKTAERLLVDLRGSLSLPSIDPSGSTSGSSAVGEVREALVGLGYGQEEIRDVLLALPSDADSATLLRDALSTLSKS
jgi:Holliday junction DNA helicase RuvA